MRNQVTNCNSETRQGRAPKERSASQQRGVGPAMWLGIVGILSTAAACGPDATAPGTTPSGTATPPITGAAGSPTTAAVAGRAAPATTAGAAAPGGAPAVINTGAVAGTGGNVPATGGDVTAGAADILPCGVSQALATNCQNCHGATPIGGAPMPLVTYADLHKPAPTQPAMKVYQVVNTRIHDMMRPMPPISKMSVTDVDVIDKWVAAAAPKGTAADANCVAKPPAVENLDGTYGRLTPGAGETCYEFKVHASTTSVDAAKYDVANGEHYEQFYYKVPWPADSVATSYATISDNAQVLHHWLLFSTDEGEKEGFHKTVPLPTLIGTNPVLLAGWAVGGPNLVAPKEVGFELPNPNKILNVQWHFYNSTNKPQADASSVQICVVPKAMRANVGGVTWLGTEDLNGTIWTGGPGMPPHQISEFTTTCNPGREGLSATTPIHIIGFEPHMHRIGMNMKTIVNRKGGMAETVFDKPFNFGNETHYFADVVVQPGETLTTSCKFNNTYDVGVPFGESSDSEMCYQFVFSYPAHALRNGAFSLLGVTDTCW